MGVVFTIAFWPLVVPLVLLYVMAHPKYIPLFLWLCILFLFSIPSEYLDNEK